MQFCYWFHDVTNTIGTKVENIWLDYLPWGNNTKLMAL